MTNTPESQKLCSEADIIVVERNYFGDTLTIMQYWKVRGKTVICIFDDAYDRMHVKNVSYNFWNLGEIKYLDQDSKEQITYMNPRPIEQFKWGLKIAKAIQVPSVMLAEDWSKYNKTYHVHNFLDMEKYLNVEPLYPHDKDTIIIGWCGSMSHFASFNDSGIKVGLERIAKKYKNVKILISGDKRIYDLLETDKKVFQPFVPAEHWTPLVKTLDIGLCPLAGEYDKRRSWIKALEYMALKVPWIATDFVTYDELNDYGIMCNNGFKHWEYCIAEMLDNYPKYKERAETIGFDFALSQSSEINVEKVTIPLYQMLLGEPYPT